MGGARGIFGLGSPRRAKCNVFFAHENLACRCCVTKIEQTLLVCPYFTMDQVNIRKGAIDAIIGECNSLVSARATTNHLFIARHDPIRAHALNEEKHRQREAKQVQDSLDVNKPGGFERDYRDRLHRVAEEVTDELLAQSPASKPSQQKLTGGGHRRHSSNHTTVMTGITQEV